MRHSIWKATQLVQGTPRLAASHRTLAGSGVRRGMKGNRQGGSSEVYLAGVTGLFNTNNISVGSISPYGSHRTDLQSKIVIWREWGVRGAHAMRRQRLGMVVFGRAVRRRDASVHRHGLMGLRRGALRRGVDIYRHH